MIRRILTFLGAALVTYVLAALLASNSALDSIVALGLPISLGQRLSANVHDLLGMATSFLPLVVIALLIAFLVASLAARRLPGLRLPLFALAGAVAIVGIHVTLKLTFDITPIAAARTAGGLLMQGAAGAVGAYLFARLQPPGVARSPDAS
ncbi:MAG: hypothetical protein KJO31_06130 [Gammaproteobacteria bacterium]|nr:hypothetical protein [Gammaproteobacteria bacterium]